MYYVYILRSLKDGGLYIGSTNNLKKRLKTHNDGKSFATKGRIPFEIIHYQAFVSKQDAIDTEKYFKTTRGWQRIKRMLKNTLFQQDLAVKAKKMELRDERDIEVLVDSLRK